MSIQYLLKWNDNKSLIIHIIDETIYTSSKHIYLEDYINEGLQETKKEVVVQYLTDINFEAIYNITKTLDFSIMKHTPVKPVEVTVAKPCEPVEVKQPVVVETKQSIPIQQPVIIQTQSSIPPQPAPIKQPNEDSKKDIIEKLDIINKSVMDVKNISQEQKQQLKDNIENLKQFLEKSSMDVCNCMEVKSLISDLSKAVVMLKDQKVMSGNLQSSLNEMSREIKNLHNVMVKQDKRDKTVNMKQSKNNNVVKKSDAVEDKEIPPSLEVGEKDVFVKIPRRMSIEGRSPSILSRSPSIERTLPITQKPVAVESKRSGNNGSSGKEQSQETQVEELPEQIPIRRSGMQSQQPVGSARLPRRIRQ